MQTILCTSVVTQLLGWMDGRCGVAVSLSRAQARNDDSLAQRDYNRKRKAAAESHRLQEVVVIHATLYREGKYTSSTRARITHNTLRGEPPTPILTLNHAAGSENGKGTIFQSVASASSSRASCTPTF